MSAATEIQNITALSHTPWTDNRLPVRDNRRIRIGYLVPEFPGQTHIFFWRELEALAELGIDAKLLSTRKPPPEIVCHAWAESAISATQYLYPAGWLGLLDGLRGLLRCRPSRLLSCLKIIRGSAKKKADYLSLIAFVFFAARVAAWARRSGIGYIHAHSCANAAYLLTFANRLAGIKYSLTLHGELSYYGNGQEAKWQYAEKVIVVNQDLKRKVLRLLPQIKKEKIVVAPMGVDVSRFSRTSEYAAWQSGIINIFSCGRLDLGKGHQDLFCATATLKKLGYSLRVQIAGEGPDRTALERRIEELDLKGSVHLLGAVREERVIEALNEAHVFVLASRAEALSVATMEAMSMGVPVIVSDVGGVSELVRNGIDGILVRPGRPHELVEAIHKIITTPSLAKEFSRSGSERVRASFRATRSASILAQIARQSVHSNVT